MSAQFTTAELNASRVTARYVVTREPSYGGGTFEALEYKITTIRKMSDYPLATGPALAGDPYETSPLAQSQPTKSKAPKNKKP